MKPRNYWRDGIKYIFVVLFSTMSISSHAAETIFNSKGERIELKDDGTYVNHGVPTASVGFVFSIIAAKPSTMEWGEEKVESSKLKVKVVNNTKFNLKKAMTSFRSVDDLGQEYGTMSEAMFGTVREGETQISSGLNLLGKCTDLTSGAWKVLGEINKYAMKVHEKGISTDDLLDLVKYSNSGLVKFTNSSK